MKRLIVLISLSLTACGGEEANPGEETSHQEGHEGHGESMDSEGTHSTTGEIRQIGDDGRVDIAHEEIEGYMPAMTMPFFGEPAQLEGLSVGDRVSFSFTVEEGGKHVLSSITKQ